jgi:hypothetical protein
MQMARGGRGPERRRMTILGFANFAVSEEMEETLALFGRRMLCHDFATSVADQVQPVGNAIVEALFNFLPKPLGHCGAFPGSRDGDLEIAAADDSGKIKIAVGRIVHGIAEDAEALGFDKYGAIDRSVGRGSDGKECACEVGKLKFARQPADLSGSGELLYFGICAGRDDGDAGSGFEKRCDLRSCDRAGANDEAWASSELDENR